MLRRIFKIIRITVGFILLLWGTVGVLIPILPCGIWTIFLGVALLARDISWFEKRQVQFKAWFRKKILRKKGE